MLIANYETPILRQMTDLYIVLADRQTTRNNKCTNEEKINARLGLMKQQ